MRSLAYQRQMGKDSGKNSMKIFNKLPKANCGMAREGKTTGDCRYERNLQSFQALLLMHRICIKKRGQTSREIILVNRPGRVDQLQLGESRQVLLHHSLLSPME